MREHTDISSFINPQGVTHRGLRIWRSQEKRIGETSQQELWVNPTLQCVCEPGSPAKPLPSARGKREIVLGGVCEPQNVKVRID